jgi:hypothetical protein
MQQLQHISNLYRLGQRLISAINARDIQVSFKKVYADRQHPFLGFFEVDSMGLPRHIKPDTLTRSDFETFLSNAIGYPVRILNHDGLTFCINLKA